ncbi:MAG: hypothetical protein HYX92_16750 [Chloroflexi bacterium]|nr:hypothetical protein [Chloroflexota bacterium]
MQGSQASVAQWLLLVIDMADFAKRAESGGIDVPEAATKLKQFAARARESAQLAAEVSTLHGATQDYAEFRNIVAKTQAAIESYLAALGAEDEDSEEAAKDLLEEVFDYAAVVLGAIRQ